MDRKVNVVAAEHKAYIRHGKSFQTVLLQYRGEPKKKDASKLQNLLSKRKAAEVKRIATRILPEATPPTSPTHQIAYRSGNFTLTNLEFDADTFNEILNSYSDTSCPASLFPSLKKRVGTRRKKNSDITSFQPAINLCYQYGLAYVDILHRHRRKRQHHGREAKVIRAPVPWHQQVLISKQFLYYNLFLCHDVLLAIRRAWEARYASVDLFDPPPFPSLASCLPLTPEKLLEDVAKRCDNFKNLLVTEWVPNCAQILVVKKQSWHRLVPTKPKESMRQVRRFFSSINRLLALLLRRLVLTWIERWKSYLLPYKDSSPPCIPLLLLTAKESSIEGLDCICEVMQRCVDKLVDISEKIPRIETILLTTTETSEECIPSLSLNEELIQEMPIVIQDVVATHYNSPARYIASVYEPLLHLLDTRSLPDWDTSLLSVDGTLYEQKLDKAVQENEELLRKIHSLPNWAYLSLFQLSCSSLNSALLDAVKLRKRSLEQFLVQHNRKMIRQLCSQFELLTERASTIPTNTAQLVGLSEFLIQAQTVDTPELKRKVEESALRLLLILNYIVLPSEDVMLNCRLFHWPKDLASVLAVSSGRLDHSRMQAQSALIERTKLFHEKLVQYSTTLDFFKKKESPTLSIEEMTSNSEALETLNQQLLEAQQELQEINEDERLLGWDLTESPILPNLLLYIDPYYRLWHTALRFHLKYETWYHGPFRQLNSEEVAADTDCMLKEMILLSHTFMESIGPRRVAEAVKSRLEKFRLHLPLLKAICNPALRERHWLAGTTCLENPWVPEPVVSLSDLICAGLGKHTAHLEQVSRLACQERALEEALERMLAEWETVHFRYQPYRNSGVSILVGVEEIQALLDEHILKAQTMHSSPYIEPLRETLREWEHRLVSVQDCIDIWLKVQSTWLYLEPIFASEDILRQMPADGAKFAQVDMTWKQLMEGLPAESRVLHAAGQEGLLERLKDASALLEDIQHGLHEYLEKKRAFFPRFYFLSNDELLDLLSKTKEPHRVQPHLNKCFQGVKRLQFREGHQGQEVVAMVSFDEETVTFTHPVVPADSKGMVELWMAQVAQSMTEAVRKLINEALETFPAVMTPSWLLLYPVQAVCCAAALQWTAHTESALQNEGLRTYLAQWNSALEHLAGLMQSPLNALQRNSLHALILFYMQARDVLNHLIKENITSADDFEWDCQLRYYLVEKEEGEDKKVEVRMVLTKLNYGYEYLGSCSRLLVTPQTDRCYRALMGAVHGHMGGALHGPAAYGKTSCVRELAWAVAKQFLLFQCSESMEAIAVATILKGTAQSGSWACLEDFHRLPPGVLTTIAQQLQGLQAAMSRGLRRFHWEGTEINLDPSCAIFATLRPNNDNSKYFLPDQVKHLFRSVVVHRPDEVVIVSGLLYSMGFMDADKLSRKLVAIFRLCQEEFASNLYDWSLRTLRTVVDLAGLQKAHYLYKDEMGIVVEALCSVIEFQLPIAKIARFQKLMSHIFPDVETSFGPSDHFRAIATAVCQELFLEPLPEFIAYAHKLHEQVTARRGVILLGDSLSGKSTLLKVVSKISSKLSNQEIFCQILNPSAMTLQGFYGQSDATEGILSKACRQCATQCANGTAWLIMDGPLDLWVQGLQTALEPAGRLTLPSGEILQLPDKVHLIFETDRIGSASPAILSRCAVVYVEHLPERAVSFFEYRRFSKEMDKDKALLVQALAEGLLYPSVQFVVKHSSAFPLSPALLYHNFYRLLSVLLSQEEETSMQGIPNYFVFAILWGVAAFLTGSERQKFETFIREKLIDGKSFGNDTTIPSISLPKGSLFQFAVQKLNCSWIPWEAITQQELPSPKFTLESSLIQTYFLHRYIQAGVPALVLGPEGSGKSFVSHTYLQSLPGDRFIANYIPCTPQMSPALLQDAIMAGLDRRRKGVFGPTLGRKCILFLDDLQIFAWSPSGVRAPLELMRTWLELQVLFDKKDASRMELVDMLVLAAAQSYLVSEAPRLIRHFGLIPIASYDPAQLKSILGTAMETRFGRYAQLPLQRVFKPVINASVDLWLDLSRRFVSTPDKPHYSCSVADLVRFFLNLLRLPWPDHQEPTKFLQFWLHELYRTLGGKITTEDDEELFRAVVGTVCHNDLKTSGDKLTRGIQFLTSISKSGATVYDEVPDMEEFTSLLESFLTQYNNEGQKPFDWLLCDPLVELIVRIHRILILPKEHLVIVGLPGHGRRSCARLAAFLAQCAIFEVKQGQIYGLMEWREDLKSLLRQSFGQKTMFLCSDHQLELGQDAGQMREDLARLLAAGDFPQLFSPDEKLELMEKVQMMDRDQHVATDFSPAVLYENFLQRVQANLHVVLCVSPRGHFWQWQAPLYPQFRKYCHFEWVKPWSPGILKKVGMAVLVDLDFEPCVLEKCVDLCVKIYGDALEKAGKRQEMEGSKHFVTPMAFLQMVRDYREVFCKKRTKFAAQRDRYVMGLEQLEFAATQVVLMQEELTKLQPQLLETSAETEALMIKIEQDTVEVEAQKEVVAADEALANEAAAAAQAIKDECENDLAEANPALEAAVTALDTLQPADVTLVKAMRRPPPVVKLVLEAVCVMVNVGPVRKPDLRGSGQMVEDYWTPAQKLLGDLKFLDNLREYDKDNIAEHVMKRIRDKYLPHPDFDPALVRHVSTACEGLCKWVRAMEVYDRVARIVAPKRARLTQAEQDLAQQMARLAEKHTQLQQITDKLQALNDDFAAMSKKKKDLEDSIQLCSQKLERAEKLISGLGGEKERWLALAQSLNDKLMNLVGDALLAAAVLSFSSYLPWQERQECLLKWHALAREMDIACAETYSLKESLDEPNPSQTLQFETDPCAMENILLMENSHFSQLIVDPHDQALQWLKLKGQHEGLLQELEDSSEILPKLIHAIEKGLSVAVELALAESLHDILEPLVARQVCVRNGVNFVRLDQRWVPVSSNFRLYVLAATADLKIIPETLLKMRVINFDVTKAGLEGAFLAVVVTHERCELEEKRRALRNQRAVHEQQLRDLEDRILHVLTLSKGNILEDETAIRTLHQSKLMSEDVIQKQRAAEQTEREIDTTRNQYRDVATWASTLFFCTQKPKLLNPMYCYSLEAFTNLYTQSILKSRKSALLDERLAYINEYLTRATHGAITRFLWNQDKLAFTVLLALESYKHKGELSEALLRLWLKTPEKPESSPSAVSWIDPTEWQRLVSSGNQIKSLKGLTDDIVRCPLKWREFLETPNASLPSPWANLSFLEEWIVLRGVKPSELSVKFKAFVTEILGTSYLEGKRSGGDAVTNAVQESSSCAPLLYLVPPEVDPVNSVKALGESLGIGKGRVRLLNCAKESDSSLWNVTERCMADGGWAVMQNIQTNLQWAEKIVKFIRAKKNETHPEFRLWLLGPSDFSYPSFVLQHSIKIVGEVPQGIREIMGHLVACDLLALKTNETEESMQRAPETDPHFFNTWRKLSTSLALFHTLLMERGKYLEEQESLPLCVHDLVPVLDYLKGCLVNKTAVPFRALQRLVAGYYVSHMIAENPEGFTVKLLQRFLTPELLLPGTETWALCTSIALPKGDHPRVIAEWLRSLPDECSCVCVALPPSAALACDKRDIHQALSTLTLFILEPVDSTCTTDIRWDKVNKRIDASLDALPSAIDDVILDECAKTEVSFFNEELWTVRQVLKELRLVCSGQLHLDTMRRNQIVEIHRGYFEGEMLRRRLYRLKKTFVMLKAWTMQGLTKRSPLVLPLLTRPQRVLQGLLLAVSKKIEIPFESLEWVSSMEPSSESIPCEGLRIKGATWNTDTGSIELGYSPEPSCSLPVTFLKPRPKASFSNENLGKACQLRVHCGGNPSTDVLFTVVLPNPSYSSEDTWCLVQCCELSSK